MLLDVAHRVHCSDDRVWSLAPDDNLPRNTRMSVEEFCTSPHVAGHDCYHVVGSRSNAKLITQLYAARMSGRIKSLQLVTPMVCRTRAEREQPEAVLYHMSRFRAAASLGGCHEMTPFEYPIYAMAAELQRRGTYTEMVRRLFREHYLYRLLRYIPHIHEGSCAVLVAELLDPRWYIDVCKPDRAAKMEAYLGLVPKTTALVLNSDVPNQTPAAQRCTLAIKCWSADMDYLQRAKLNFMEHGLAPQPQTDAPGLTAADFVLRIWGQRIGFGPATVAVDPIKGVLRASQHFLHFLRLNWLGALYRSATFESGLRLFRSRDFFRHVVEADAFDHYISRVDSGAAEN